MAQIWQRVTGRSDIRPFVKKTGAALVVGELVALDDDTYNIFAAATDKLVFGIAQDALASSSTADVRVDVLKPGDVVRVKVATGTAAATEKGNYADIGSSTTGISLTESNNDCIVVGFPKEGYQDVIFTTLHTAGPATATVSD
jgi:hypothetical protein